MALFACAKEPLLRSFLKLQNGLRLPNGLPNQGGDYALAPKGNQATLLADVKSYLVDPSKTTSAAPKLMQKATAKGS